MRGPGKQLTTSTYHVAKALVTRGAIRETIRLALDVHDGVAGRVEHLAATPEESHPKINKRENRAKNYQLDPSVLDGTTGQRKQVDVNSVNMFLQTLMQHAICGTSAATSNSWSAILFFSTSLPQVSTRWVQSAIKLCTIHSLNSALSINGNI